MKNITLLISAMALSLSTVFAGSSYSGKETQAVQQSSCPQWYADNEFNVNLWGTYAFTGEEWRNDRYIEADHAWGGGIDAKYFFHRYFGLGIEGWAAEASRERVIEGGFVGNQFVLITDRDSRVVGSVLGTVTLRYPIQCTRFAPYVWAGGGVMLGGGERDRIDFGARDGIPGFFLATHTNSRAEAVGQFGGGLEVRLTPHIGLLGDFSWNVIDGPQNNFGMVRSGLTFAF